MIEHPLLLIVLGVTLASAIATRIARRRSRATLARLSDEDLAAALEALHVHEAGSTRQTSSSVVYDQERHRITLLVLEELSRRRSQERAR